MLRVKLISSDCSEATGIIKNLTWTLRIGKFSRGQIGEGFRARDRDVERHKS